MKPYHHALSTARRYGGSWRDWIKAHDFFDQSKAVFPSMQHRMFLHADFGIWLAGRVFGDALEASDGTVVPTDVLGVEHQREDLGRVFTLAEWLREVPSSSLTKLTRETRGRFAPIRKDARGGLAARWGGRPGDFDEVVGFFDKPAELAPDSPIAQLVTHNSFGIFLAEQLLGTTLELTKEDGSPRLVPVRSIAEDLVIARTGYIPAAASVAASIPLRGWMRGANLATASRVWAGADIPDEEEEAAHRASSVMSDSHPQGRPATHD